MTGSRKRDWDYSARQRNSIDARELRGLLDTLRQVEAERRAHMIVAPTLLWDGHEFAPPGSRAELPVPPPEPAE